MRAQSEIVSLVLLLAVVVLSAVAMYSYFQSVQTHIESTSTAQSQQIATLPPRVESSITQPPAPTHRETTLCAYVRNDSPHPLRLSNVVLYLYQNGILIFSETNTYNDCSSLLPPNQVCRICAGVIIPAEGTYTYQFSMDQTPVVKATVFTNDVSLYPDLTIKSITASQNHYNSGTLLFGDYNSFSLSVTVCNSGRDDMNTTGTLTLFATNASLVQTSFTVPELNAGDCNTFTTGGNTSNPSDVVVTATISYPSTELSQRNNQRANTITNAYYRECDSCSLCNSLFDDANTVTKTYDTGAYIVLTADINATNSNCIAFVFVYPPAGRWITFDGKGHDITVNTNNPYDCVFYAAWSDHIRLRHVRASLSSTQYGNSGIRFDSSSHIDISDVNVAVFGPSDGFAISAVVLFRSSDAELSDINAFTSSSDSHAMYIGESNGTLRIDLTTAPSYFCSLQSTALPVSSSTPTCAGCASGNRLYWYGSEDSLPFDCPCAEKNQMIACGS